eukprot:13118255-Heterocapsa_arctica.AAC.1
MRARSGELQGDHAAPKRFVKLTSDVVGEWVEARRKVDGNAALDVVDPVSGEIVSLATTKFVDDVAHKT